MRIDFKRENGKGSSYMGISQRVFIFLRTIVYNLIILISMLVCLISCSKNPISSDVIVDPNKPTTPLMKVNGTLEGEFISNEFSKLISPQIGFFIPNESNVLTENSTENSTGFTSFLTLKMYLTNEFKGKFPLTFTTSIWDLPDENSLTEITTPQGLKTKIAIGDMIFFDDVNKDGLLNIGLSYDTSTRTIKYVPGSDKIYYGGNEYYLVYLEDDNFLLERNQYAATNHNVEDKWENLKMGLNIVKAVSGGNDYGGLFKTKFSGFTKLDEKEGININVHQDIQEVFNSSENHDFFYFRKYESHGGYGEPTHYYQLPVGTNITKLYVKYCPYQINNKTINFTSNYKPEYYDWVYNEYPDKDKTYEMCFEIYVTTMSYSYYQVYDSYYTSPSYYYNRMSFPDSCRYRIIENLQKNDTLFLFPQGISDKNTCIEKSPLPDDIIIANQDSSFINLKLPQDSKIKEIIFIN